MLNGKIRQKVLDLYLNADFIPLSYNLYVYGQHSFLGYQFNLGLYPKVAVFDFDGVFELPDTSPMYKLYIEKLMKENRRLESKARKIESCIRIIDSGNIPAGEKRLAEIYREAHVTKDDCENAKIGAIKEFKFANNAKKFISTIKYDLGYVPAIISGSPQLVLEPVGEILGINKSNIYGSEFRFDEKGVITKIFLRLETRKSYAQDILLQKYVNTMYGCRFFFSDDYVSDASIAKLGLNPSIFLGKFDREELPFDVAVACPEGRENMMKLIPKMYGFEFGYVVANSRTKEEEEKISELASEIQEMAKEVSKESVYNIKKSFIKKAIELCEINKFIEKKDYLIEKILDLETSRNEEKDLELISKIAEFFRKYVAESHVKRNWLED